MSIDFTNYDASQTDRLLSIEYEMMKKVDPTLAFAWAADCQVDNAITAKGGYRVRCNKLRNSGEMNTYGGNTSVHLFLIRGALSMIYGSYENIRDKLKFFVSGDDGNIGSDDYDLLL